MNNPRLSHSFDVEVASQCGVHAAILYNHIAYWIRANAAKGMNFHDGRTWMYDNMKSFSLHMPYLTFDEVRRALEKLVNSGLIIKGNYNKVKFDRTIWYALGGQVDVAKDTNRAVSSASSIWQNRQMVVANQPNGDGEFARCIDTDIETHVETDIKNTPPTPKPTMAKNAPNGAGVCVFSSHSPKPKKEAHGSHVKLSQEEHASLCKAYTSTVVSTIIDEMNDYCAASKPKGYADYAAAIRSWMRKRQGTGIQPKKDRKFSPCSDDNKARQYLEGMTMITSEEESEVEFDPNYYNHDIVYPPGYEPEGYKK